jgi:transposase
MDRGMASEENIAWLNQTGRRYIIGTPKAEMKKWAPQMADKTKWREIREGIEVQICSGPDGKETFVLCRSRDRAEKEKAMHQRFSDRITKALEKLKSRIRKAKKKLNRDAVNRQIGRILQVNQRAAARFDIELEDAATPAGFQLKVKINESFDEWALLSEGTYILRSNITDWDDEKLWKSYIQLTHAEAAFRIQKDQLSVRPIWHQKEERVEAHILVCFLAFAMWKTLEMWQEKSGLGNSPRTILEEFSRIQCHDVILPTSEGTEIRLRCIATPDKAQAAFLSTCFFSWGC